jgi:hypothetical protein
MRAEVFEGPLARRGVLEKPVVGDELRKRHRESPGMRRIRKVRPKNSRENISLLQKSMLRSLPCMQERRGIPSPQRMPSPQSQKARSHPAPVSFGLPVFAATRPAGWEGRRALLRFRGETDENGRPTGAGELTLGSRGNDFDRNSALRDKDMPSLIRVPCLVFVWTAPRNGDIGRAILRPGHAFPRSADGAPKRLRHGRASQDDVRRVAVRARLLSL